VADPAAGCLAGLHALVTGGGSGIGLAVARAYLAEGARVTVLERSAGRAAALGAEAPGDGNARGRAPGAEPGGRLAVETGDTTDPGDVARAVARATSPDGRLDILTACAGVFDFYAPVTGMSAAELTASFGEIFGINVLGTLLAVREAAPALRRANGCVTLTLSTAAWHGGGGGVLYAASKSALRGVVRHLAAELAPEVRVNGVAPGGTGATGLSGLASLGQQQTADAVAGRDERIRAGTLLRVLPVPEDHAGAYLFLASAAAARVITGTVITSDGGHAG
jgi:NAD(P)-dependent dehydrogenase (short-subunit alcohol dehydrogenase family)